MRLGLALGAAATAAAAARLLAVILGGSAERSPFAERGVSGLPAGVSANASLTLAPWGSDVAIRVRGFRPGTLCKVWLRRADGTRIAAGSFRYVYDGESDEASLSAAVDPGDATAVELRAGRRIFVAPVPRSAHAALPTPDSSQKS